MSAVLERLRPPPQRGEVIAAGSVALALVAFLIELRMTQWSLGPRFVVVALIAGLILTIAWLAALEGASPRPYHSVLLIAGLLPLILALVLLAEVLGAQRSPGSGAIAWTFAAEAAIGAIAARRAHSGACALIAALAGAVAIEAFVAWVFSPHGLGTFRAILLLVSIGYAAGALRLRDRHRRHAVALVNAAGLAALVVALSYLVITLIASAVSRLGAGGLLHGQALAPFGWKLYLLAVGFGLIAYAALDREPGPAYIGVAVLTAFAILSGVPIGERGTLVGWPLLLLVIGVAGLAVGLRPRRVFPAASGGAAVPGAGPPASRAPSPPGAESGAASPAPSPPGAESPAPSPPADGPTVPLRREEEDG